MSSYTPAPWTVDVIGENGRVAMLDCDDIDADTLEANARLISAAPELLAVLQDVREAWLAGRMGDVEGILTGDVCIEAINKALGDSHHG